jgi:hypothetical protein
MSGPPSAPDGLALDLVDARACALARIAAARLAGEAP